ncbi:MAG: hypothetical protein ABIS86_23160, partial [Streptosporangiaceae bacterium]
MTLANDLLGDPARRREARRRSAHEFRSRRTTAAMVVAAVMTAVGGIGSAEIVARQHRQNVIPPQYLDRVNAELHRLQWQDRTVVLVGYGLAAVGLVLLLHALLPGRTRLEMIRGSDPYLSAGLSHAGFRRALTDAAS